MAATPVTVVRPTIGGVNDPTPVAADTVNGNSVPNVAGLILTLNNTDSGGSHTVTFVTPATHAGYAVADPVVTLVASAKKNFSNFPSDAFGRTLTFTANSNQVMISAMAPAS
jgi:hypothetical protein